MKVLEIDGNTLVRHWGTWYWVASRKDPKAPERYYRKKARDDAKALRWAVRNCTPFGLGRLVSKEPRS